MDDVLLTERRKAVLWLTLNRPAAHNALDRALTSALCTAFEQASGDDAIRAIVLTAAGEKTFSAGADLKEGDGRMFDSAAGSNPIGDVMRAIAGCGKLVIGRINGSALAGGLGLVAACDLAYAADHAKFGLPEVKVGVFPMMVSTLLLRQIPRRRLQEMAYLGEPLSAEEAERYHIVNRVVPAAELDAAIDAVLQSLSRNAPRALAAGKRALSEFEDLPLADGLAAAERAIASLGAGPEAREGRAAFKEKRKPNWASD